MLASLQEYQVVFDAARGAFSPVRLVMPGLFLALVGLAVVAVGRRLRGRLARLTTMVAGLVVAAWAITWTTLVYRENVAANAEVRRALETGAYTTVEGQVTNYTREPRGGRRPERWTVAGHTYELSSFRLPRTPLRPGIVKEGMWVRIAEVNGQIARLEIRKP